MIAKIVKQKSWQVTPEKVEVAIRKIIETAKPVKLILFGSYLRGEIGINSDVDFLVVTGNHVVNGRKESVRIRRALRGVSMPMDIIVVLEDNWNWLKDKPGLVYREAYRHGKVMYESYK